MEGLAAIVCVLALVAAALLAALQRSPRSGPRPRGGAPAGWASRASRRPVPCYAASALLVNASERAAWHLLNEMPLGAAAVCPKVRLEDIIEACGPDRARLRWETRCRHVDFLLVDEQWRPLLVVEIDGDSHLRPGRAARDCAVDAALAAGDVEVLRLRVGESWEPRLRAWRRERQERPQRRERREHEAAIAAGRR